MGEISADGNLFEGWREYSLLSGGRRIVFDVRRAAGCKLVSAVVG